ncbi:MAG: hypothetical protein ACLPTZ_09420, partial [Beijerinckiaceae bacterium]
QFYAGCLNLPAAGRGDAPELSCNAVPLPVGIHVLVGDESALACPLDCRALVFAEPVQAAAPRPSLASRLS